MAQIPDITEKNFRKLSLLVGLDGFSYCSRDTLNDKVLFTASIDFSKYPRATKVEDHYWKAFVDHHELTRPYDEVSVIHDNNLNTFVPKALFDQDYLGSYLQYNTKVFETDFFDFDEMPNQEMNNVYIPYVNINNFLIDQFGPFTYRNANTILVTKILEMSKNRDQREVYVHFGQNRFELVVAQDRKLILFNSFDFTTREDFIYYLLFTAEQLNLNPEHFHLHLFGNVSEDDPNFKIAYKYVRNVSLAENLQPNQLEASENRRHFVLLHS